MIRITYVLDLLTYFTAVWAKKKEKKAIVRGIRILNLGSKIIVHLNPISTLCELYEIIGFFRNYQINHNQ